MSARRGSNSAPAPSSICSARLSNPAGVKRQMVGVFARHWIEPLANVLGALGAERAWVVHGSDGLDEITTTGPTFVAELAGGKVTTFEITPEDVGLTRAKPEDLRGGDADAQRRGAARRARGQARRLPRHRAVERRRGAAGRRQGRDR